ncbi:glucose-6-phosphate isomerase [Ordospora pajunii]|uniref:glucose-6-phosphate isomerase n=1 Tax=Ordospora pajunii TaxID=3039483 RepID=UPI0029527930|nr:glucose-6-phosphate isomerase [Ordospora pajunii]KAH9412291.1 glucose-6-phosphate isomerase [Ordospora pajunii]
METRIEELFEKDKHRADKMSKTVDVGCEYLHYDFSKTHLTDETIEKYLRRMSGIEGKIEAMFCGENINFTENRKVLHVLLRDKEILDMIENGSSAKLDGDRQMVHEELMKMKQFVNDFEQGKICGATGKRLEAVVNIGIGGSDLGPRMVCSALKRYGMKGVTAHFISNVDASDTIEVFDSIDAEKALFIVVSKTFTTIETIQNMELAMRYMEQRLKRSREEIASRHFIAISSNVDEVSRYGIQQVFSMWDFVGGRFSLWSAVGMSIALYVGFDGFLEMLRGGSMVDEEFRKEKGWQNAEIMHAIVEMFYSENGYDNKCIVPYDRYMEKFYLYLQQAEMESNGKPSTSNDTGMIVWGGVGTNSQHSFFQLLHQGTRKVLCEFLMPLRPLHNERRYHEIVVSNCVAQSRALMVGQKSEQKEKCFEGNRPTITICYSKLTPRTLGAMIAHYEHKIFVQGVCWGINSFDQFGVTLGKEIATNVCDAIRSRQTEKYDGSTNKILDHVSKSAE